MDGDFSPRPEVLYGTSAGCPTILVTNLSGTRDQYCGRSFFSADMREMRDGSGSNMNNGSDGEMANEASLTCQLLISALRPRAEDP